MASDERLGELERLMWHAGFTLAHAAWSVSGGETLCTLAIGETVSERRNYRFESDSIAESVERARTELRRMDGELEAWVLVFDGYLRSAGARDDALILQPWSTCPDLPARIAQRYRPKRFWRRFRLVGPPEFWGEQAAIGEDADLRSWLLHGVQEHARVAPLWPRWALSTEIQTQGSGAMPRTC
jgi:hypothetical protein